MSRRTARTAPARSRRPAAVAAACAARTAGWRVEEVDGVLDHLRELACGRPRRRRSPRPAASARRPSAPSAAWRCRPGGAARRRRSRPARPTARCRPARRGWSRRRSRAKFSSSDLRPARRTPGRRRASSSAICSMFWQYSAIHAVPSAWSSWPPPGSGALRSKTPMLSRPRNPPWKTLRSSASLRLSHQVKFFMQLLEGVLQEGPVALAGPRLLQLVDEPASPRRAPAG